MFDPIKSIKTLESLLGCSICLHDYSGLAGLAFGPLLPEWHQNRFCAAVRCGVFKSCYLMDASLCREELFKRRAAFAKLCHAGVYELVVPVCLEGAVSCAVFMGPFKALELPEGLALFKQGVRSRTCAKREISRSELPSLSASRLQGVLDAGETLCAALERHLSLAEAGFGEASLALKLKRFVARSFKRRDLYLEDLAKEFGVSRNAACKLVRRVAGKSFTELLEERRMEHARHLLRDACVKVELAAYECGYSDAAYFHRVFKRRNGVSPARYRRLSIDGVKA